MNRDELAAALRDVGATLGLLFRPYTATARAPFESYLAAMACTSVLVARHGPLLANAMFLPPGAYATLRPGKHTPFPDRLASSGTAA